MIKDSRTIEQEYELFNKSVIWRQVGGLSLRGELAQTCKQMLNDLVNKLQKQNPPI